MVVAARLHALVHCALVVFQKIEEIKMVNLATNKTEPPLVHSFFFGFHGHIKILSL